MDISREEAFEAIQPAYENLRACQQQLDMDGACVGVSRQALEEILDYVARVNAYDPKHEEAFKVMRASLVECYVEVQEMRADLFSRKAYPSGELELSDQEELERLEAIEVRARAVLDASTKQEARNG